MKLSNRKGMGILEVVVVMGIIAVLMPIVYMIFVDGIRTCNTYRKFLYQYDKVDGVVMRIRKDIEQAAYYKVVYEPDNSRSILVLRYHDYDDTGKEKTWKIEDERLYVKTDLPGAPGSFEEVLGGLDTAVVSVPAAPPEPAKKYMPSRFEKIGDKVILGVKPEATNTRIHRNRNIEKPVITEFSVKYKEFIS